MKKYELMFIVSPNLSSEETQEVISTVENVFSNFEGKILEKKEIGLRDLAYEIDKFRKGYYVLFNVETTGEAVKEYERVCRINDNIIRFISVKDE